MLITILLLYFAALWLLSRYISRGNDSNERFYSGQRRSPWLLVAYGMIGASLSGVSFVSVPGMVLAQDMTYLQTCIGFIFGYLLVAFVLLPLYYKKASVTIYEVLHPEFRKVAAVFFVISDMLGAAVKFFVVCIVLQKFVFDGLGISFVLTVPMMVIFIWLYTRKAGVKSLVFTDVFQTTCMIATLVVIIYQVSDQLGYGLTDCFTAVVNHEKSRIWVLDDFVSTQNAWKQLVSGAFIVVVMTGLNQNMMQKNLSCKTLRDAQKDMVVGGFLFVPVNFLFLALGVLLVILSQSKGVALPGTGDELLPIWIENGTLGSAALVLFVLGIVSAAFSSADSSLIAVTTSVCVDILNRKESQRLRKIVHLLSVVVFVLAIYILQYSHSDSLINLVYLLVSYTYGPLLGLFVYSLFSKREIRAGKWQIWISCIAAPLMCRVIDLYTTSQFGYHFGYELLLLNAAITLVGLSIPIYMLCERRNCQ